MTRKRPAHGNRGHRFIGVPVATCIVIHNGKPCTETRTWGPPITPTHAFTQIGGGARWDAYQMGEGIPTDPTMGAYADEGETDPQGNPFMAMDQR